MAAIGINFRATSTFVTDGTDETYCLDTDSYPTTRGGFTFGWESAPDGSANRDSGVDRRLAGINFWNNSNTSTINFRLDLPNTGEWEIGAACGDSGTFQQDMDLAFKDDASAISGTGVVDGDSGTDEYFDITGVLRTTEATFFTDWATVNHTFTSTVFRVTLGTTSAATRSTVINHLFAKEASTGGSTTVPVSGVSATGGAGTFTITASGSVTLAGVAATGAVGDLTIVTLEGTTVTLTGVSATGSAGTMAVTASTSFTLGGVEGAGFVGTVTAVVPTDVVAELTGVLATGSAGQIIGTLSALNVTSTDQLQKPVDYQLAGDKDGLIDGGKIPMALRRRIFNL